MSMTATTKPSARERLLNSANELFYSEGVHTVGIDRVIEHAGVAKASLYNTFGSKEKLIEAYLQLRHSNISARIDRALARYDTPRERLLAVFEAQAELFAEPTFRGCAFQAASAEEPAGSAVAAAAGRYRAWVRSLLTDLAAAAGAADPAGLGRQLQLVYNGSSMSARTDRDPAAANVARSIAEALLDAAGIR